MIPAGPPFVVGWTHSWHFPEADSVLDRPSQDRDAKLRHGRRCGGDDFVLAERGDRERNGFMEGAGFDFDGMDDAFHVGIRSLAPADRHGIIVFVIVAFCSPMQVRQYRIWRHAVYHESAVANLKDMKTWTEHLGHSRLRSFTDNEGHFWLEQNSAKAPKWGRLARQGHDVAWEFAGPGGAYTGGC